MSMSNGEQLVESGDLDKLTHGEGCTCQLCEWVPWIKKMIEKHYIKK